jgi:hypothetical protein
MKEGAPEKRRTKREKNEGEGGKDREERESESAMKEGAPGDAAVSR